MRLVASNHTHRSGKPVRIPTFDSGLRSRPPRILDFDVEARPLHWINSEYVSKEITAIACRFVDETPEDMRCWLLGRDDPVEMLQGFVELYDQADIVSGHYIRGYDLPVINGALTEYKLPLLSDKATIDTKGDLPKRSGLSGSMENLGTMLGLEHPKVQMDQTKWRAANRLTPEGIELTRQRVCGDVEEHIELLSVLMKLDYLGLVQEWKSHSSKPTPGYTP